MFLKANLGYFQGQKSINHDQAIFYFSYFRGYVCLYKGKEGRAGSQISFTIVNDEIPRGIRIINIQHKHINLRKLSAGK